MVLDIAEANMAPKVPKDGKKPAPKKIAGTFRH